MKTLETTLFKILRNIIPKDKRRSIELDSELVSDLGCDSLALIRLVVELEKKAGYDSVKAGDEVDFTKIVKVKDVLELVTNYNKNIN